MKSMWAVLFALLSTVAGSESRQSVSSPVEQVVDLLNDLKQQAVQDGDKEQKMYDKYACFCDKALKAKANAIDKARADLRSLGQGILKFRGKISTLALEVQEIGSGLSENLASQEDATALRQNEHAEYEIEKSEVVQVLEALEQAIKILKGATKRASLLQSESTAKIHAMKRVLQAVPSSARLTEGQLSFLSEVADDGTQYSPQSESIQGILSNMYQTFSSDLQSSTATEAKRSRDYEKFIEVKQKEQRDLDKVKGAKDLSKAETDQQLSEASDLYDETEKQLKADISFFDVTKEGCISKQEEWALRSQQRTEELKGIDQAIGVLSSDKARSIFNKAINLQVGADKNIDIGVFLQLQSHDSMALPVVHAYQLLKTKATASRSLRLAQLAMHIHESNSGHFKEVIASLDKMIVAIEEEAAADIKKRDQCQKEYSKTELAMETFKRKIRGNQAEIEKLDAAIGSREEDKSGIDAAIKDVEEQLKAMETQRKAEKSQILQSKKDDQSAIAILEQASKALAMYYKKRGIDMSLIEKGSTDLAFRQDQPAFEVSKFQAPEAKFSGKGSRKGQANNILSIIEMIVEDLKDEIRNGEKQQGLAQLDFEKAMEAAKNLKMDLTEKKLILVVAIADNKIEQTEEKKALKFNQAELDDQVKYKAGIKADCDWILGAFEKRSKVRSMELDGLSGAKEYLNGQSGAALLEMKRSERPRLRAHLNVGAVGEAV
jgi:hypothetical protein